MASVKALDGTKLLVQIETTPGGGVFAHDCLINMERGISFTADGNDVMVPNCENPSLPAWRQKVIDSMSASISGSGKLHTASTETFFTWLTSGLSKNIRFKVDTTGAEGGGYFAGAFKITNFAITGTRGDKAEAEIGLENDGVVTWVDAA
jgi:predicted secreted protein